MESNRSFAATLRKAAKNSWKAGDISRWQYARIRTASRFRPEMLEEAQAAVQDEAIAAGLCMSDETFGDGFDWDALLAFIEKLLPMILQLISLF